MFQENIRSRTSFSSSPNGFTLPEIVVVIVIIGILYLLTAGPATLTVSTNSTLVSGSNQIQADLARSRNRALNKQLIQKVVFVPASDTYSFYEKHPTQNLWVLIQNAYQLPDGLGIASTSLANSQVVFDVDGTPYEDPQADLPLQSLDSPLTLTRNITLELSGGQQKQVLIVPETGTSEVAP